MKLSNRFKEEDKIRVWVDHPYCALCESNQGCALHHIDGTKSSSIYNGIMLCYNCHKIADSHNTQSQLSTAYRSKLRVIAYNRVKKSDHIDNQNDKDYQNCFNG
jgi:hypothetical protein